jgi:hypothetical protein
MVMGSDLSLVYVIMICDLARITTCLRRSLEVTITSILTEDLSALRVALSDYYTYPARFFGRDGPRDEGD